MSERKVDADGNEEWAEGGSLHRTDGPALVFTDGAEAWYVRGERHRTDGPAVTHDDGEREWWLNGDPLPAYCFDALNEAYDAGTEPAVLSVAVQAIAGQNAFELADPAGLQRFLEATRAAMTEG